MQRFPTQDRHAKSSPIQKKPKHFDDKNFQNPLKTKLTRIKRDMENSPLFENSIGEDHEGMRLSKQFKELVRKCEKSKLAVDHINRSLYSKTNEIYPNEYEGTKELLQHRSALLNISGKLSPPGKLVLRDLDSKRSPLKAESGDGEREEVFGFSPVPNFRSSYQKEQNEIQKGFERSDRYKSILNNDSDEDENPELKFASPTQKLKKFKNLIKEQEKDMEDENLNLELHYKELKAALEKFTDMVKELEIQHTKKDMQLALLQDDVQKNIEELGDRQNQIKILETSYKRLTVKDDERNHSNLGLNVQINTNNRTIRGLEEAISGEQTFFEQRISQAQRENQYLKKEVEILRTREELLTEENAEKSQRTKELDAQLRVFVDESQQVDKSTSIKNDQIQVLREKIGTLASENSSLEQEFRELENQLSMNEKTFLDLQKYQKQEHQIALNRQIQELENRKAEISMIKDLIKERKKLKDETMSETKLTNIKIEDVLHQGSRLENDKEELKCKLNQLEKDIEIATKNCDKLKLENNELTQSKITQEIKVKEFTEQKNNFEARAQVLEGKLGYKNKVAKNITDHNKTMGEKKEDLLKVSSRSREHFAELQNKSDRMQKKYKEDILISQKKLQEVSQELDKVQEQKKTAKETCAKLETELETKKSNRKTSGKDYKRLKSENELLNKTLVKMASDLEVLLKQNQEKEDQKRRDHEFKTRAYQKLLILEEIQKKIKHYKYAQKMLKLSEEIEDL